MACLDQIPYFGGLDKLEHARPDPSFWAGSSLCKVSFVQFAKSDPDLAVCQSCLGYLDPVLQVLRNHCARPRRRYRGVMKLQKIAGRGCRHGNENGMAGPSASLRDSAHVARLAWAPF